MVKKRKRTTSNWEPEQDPVWILEEDILKPSLFFLRWWQRTAELKYDTRDRWLDIAVELGYVIRLIDSASDQIYYEPIGFDYDPELVRNTLRIPEEMPIIYCKKSNRESYLHMWNALFSDEEEGSEQ